MENKTEGWMKLDNAKLWHYFRDGRSLCGKWMTFSQNYDETENIDSPDNCKACKNKRSKELSNSNPASCRKGRGNNNAPDIISSPAKPLSQTSEQVNSGENVGSASLETGGGFTIISMGKIGDEEAMEERES